jgi:hypothetical protein
VSRIAPEPGQTLAVLYDIVWRMCVRLLRVFEGDEGDAWRSLVLVPAGQSLNCAIPPAELTPRHRVVPRFPPDAR